MTDETTDLRARVRALEEITEPEFIWGAMDNVHDMDVTLDDYAKAVSRAQRAALAASQPADSVTNASSCQPVKVKPLVWAQVDEGCFVAHSDFGDYVVELHDQWGMWTPRENDFASEAHSWHMTEDNAKAAAQTNFNTHTLASIEPASVTPAEALKVPEVRALVDALEFYADRDNYEPVYERMPCDCCTDIYEPVKRDEGDTARAAIAALKESPK